MLHRLGCLLPQLIRQLLCFFASLLDFWIRPFEIECKIEVCLIFALRNGIVDEAACVEITKVDLRRCRAISFIDNMTLVQAGVLPSVTYLPWSTNVHVLDNCSTWGPHAFLECCLPLHEAICLLDDLAGDYGNNKKLRLTTFDLHHFPKLGKSENRRGLRRIDRAGLGLIEDDHVCGCRSMLDGRAGLVEDLWFCEFTTLLVRQDRIVN